MDNLNNKISIFGLGYVGCVSLGCLAEEGNHIIGVDIADLKIELINKGQSPIVEEKINHLISDNHKRGRVKATKDTGYAIDNSKISFICVGTPNDSAGHLNLSFIYNTAKEIGKALKTKETFHTIVIRSTVSPGTTEKYAEIVEKISGKTRDIDFGVVYNPEFLREGSAVSDYYNPPVTVIASSSNKSIELIRELYSFIDASVEIVPVNVAEMVKFLNNSWHALKITFANEVGNICKEYDIDSHQLMNLFVKDKILNISPAYLKPGFAYGGSCLPKDLAGLVMMGKQTGITTPVLSAIKQSNEYHKEKAFRMIKGLNKKRIGLIGLSFKEGTDDLRFSPAVDLTKKLIGEGYSLSIYDKSVDLAKLIGGNKSYIKENLPHIEKLVSNDLKRVIEHSDVIVVNQKNIDYRSHLPNLKSKYIIDLARVDLLKNSCENYEGINW